MDENENTVFRCSVYLFTLPTNIIKLVTHICVTKLLHIYPVTS